MISLSFRRTTLCLIVQLKQFWYNWNNSCENKNLLPSLSSWLIYVTLLNKTSIYLAKLNSTNDFSLHFNHIKHISPYLMFGFFSDFTAIKYIFHLIVYYDNYLPLLFKTFYCKIIYFFVFTISLLYLFLLNIIIFYDLFKIIYFIYCISIIF